MMGGQLDIQSRKYWEGRYAHNAAPWDTGRADPAVMNFIRKLNKNGKCIELGCGPGNEAIAL